MKTCPFCGSEDLENLDAAAWGGPVMCIDCGARGPCRLAALSLKVLGAKSASAGIADGLEAWECRASGVAS